MNTEPLISGWTNASALKRIETKAGVWIGRCMDCEHYSRPDPDQSRAICLVSGKSTLPGASCPEHQRATTREIRYSHGGFR